ncbi:MFS transporter [Sinomonas sp. ASV486]|uniref:MFS transporter n=1 Tax=Sinomonas sp. ASV486 TaxID=3051170 RepID=UPI0027DAF444|nr:MFS transporter [Sinomonas sp. ASV486]MDQ4491288.1 MFS transporter [Sinomonas sp. ASV486]
MNQTTPQVQASATSTSTRRWLALATLMIPVLLISVDNTVLGFAVPAISLALKPTSTEMLWIVDVYALVLAGLLVPMGSIGDRIGRRRILLIGATGFAIVSVAAAFATTAGQLIAARAAIGIFGSMLMPATLSLIRNIFDNARERRLAVAIWASVYSGGAAFGPLLGGVLLEHFPWGSVFLIAVPMLVPALLLTPVLVPESRDPAPSPVDPVSIALVVTAAVALVWGIKEIAHDGGPAAAAAVLLGLGLGTAFVRRQLTRERPMLDVRLFARPMFSASIGANLVSFFSLVGFMYFLSQHLQLVAGASPLDAGLLMLPGAALSVVAGLAAVRLASRFSAASVMVAGLVMNAAGYAVVLAFGRDGSMPALLTGFAVVGVGVGLAETLSNDLILASVPPAKAGAASAISETAYELGAVLGTAILGSILGAAYRLGVQVPAGLPAEAAAQARETLGGAVDAASLLPPDAAGALLDSARRAFDSGVASTSAIAAVLMAGAAVVVLRALRTRDASRSA